MSTALAARERVGSRLSVTTLLTVYLVLLVGVPSSARVTALGSLGQPSTLWGLLLLFWWALAWLQGRTHRGRGVSQPVRWMLGAFVVVALVSLAAALLRGQPADQVSPALTSAARIASWSGVFLVALDGIHTTEQLLALVRHLTLVGTGLAALGLAQFLTGKTLLDWMAGVPGLTVDIPSVVTRGAFTRPSGTAIHPLEYGAAVVATIPLAITTAVHGGFRTVPSRWSLGWWLPVLITVAASMISVSRSGMIGLVVALVLSLPVIPKAFRWPLIVAGLVVQLAVFVVVPGMFNTLKMLFTGVSDDPSALSRTGALDSLPAFMSTSPLVGTGFGTFLPRYYIFDNAYALMAVELGVLGVACFAGLIATAAFCAYREARRTRSPELRAAGRGLAASVLSIAVVFLFFDGLSFPISAGLLFLLLGTTGAVRALAAGEAPPPVAVAPRESVGAAA